MDALPPLGRPVLAEIVYLCRVLPWVLPLGPGETFGRGCIRGVHTDRGQPNLTLRLSMEKDMGRRLVQT